MNALSALLFAARLARRARTDEPASQQEDPLPGFASLSRALRQRGIPRAPTETLARYARRLEREAGLPDELRARSAELGRRYELVRYAARGDAPALEREMRELAGRVGRGG